MKGLWKAAAVAAVVLVGGAGTAPAEQGCDRQLVMQIDAAKVSPEGGGFAIFAFGTSESAGWSNATLLAAGAANGVATVDFVACRPQMSAQVLSPIQARTTLNLGAETRKVVIRARTNSMTVDITRK